MDSRKNQITILETKEDHKFLDLTCGLLYFKILSIYNKGSRMFSFVKLLKNAAIFINSKPSIKFKTASDINTFAVHVVGKNEIPLCGSKYVGYVQKATNSEMILHQSELQTSNNYLCFVCASKITGETEEFFIQKFNNRKRTNS